MQGIDEEALSKRSGIAMHSAGMRASYTFKQIHAFQQAVSEAGTFEQLPRQYQEMLLKTEHSGPVTLASVKQESNDGSLCAVIVENSMIDLTKDDGSLDAIVTEHLMGKHDQSTHGNKFGTNDKGDKVQIYKGGSGGYKANGLNYSKGKVSQPAPTGYQHPAGVPMDLLKSPAIQHCGDHPDVAHDVSNGDKLLMLMSKDNGFDAKPQLMDAKQMAQHIKDGNTAVYRGIAGSMSDHFAQQFKTGDYWVGRGIYGNGTYTAVNNGKTTKSSNPAMKTAQGYATGSSSGAYSNVVGGGRGTVMSMAMSKNANVGNYHTISSQMNQDYAAFKPLQDHANAQATAHPSNATYQKVAAQYNAIASVYQDTGRYAAYKGYDAYTVPQGTKVDYMVVLNRGKLAVQQ